mgnify:CR=1 FL=1
MLRGNIFGFEKFDRFLQKKRVCNGGDTILCHGRLHTDVESVQSRELGQSKKSYMLGKKQISRIINRALHSNLTPFTPGP